MVSQQKMLFLAAYVAAGIAFGMHMMEWTLTESAYWLTVTVTTVGYGDYSPTKDDQTKIIGCGFILVGIAIVGNIVQELVGDMIGEINDDFIAEIDGEKKEKKPKSEFVSDQILALIYLAAVLGCGTYVFHIYEGFTYVDSLYWTICTVTTVGYGDMSIESDTTRVFLIFYIIIGIWAFTNAFSELAEAGIKEQLAKRRARLSAMVLTHDMIKKMDDDPDGTAVADGKVSSGEFLMYCLGEQKMCSRADCAPWLAKFRKLDVDNSGYLDKKDLNKLVADAATAAVVQQATPAADAATPAAKNPVTETAVANVSEGSML